MHRPFVASAVLALLSACAGSTTGEAVAPKPTEKPVPSGGDYVVAYATEGSFGLDVQNDITPTFDGERKLVRLEDLLMRSDHAYGEDEGAWGATRIDGKVLYYAVARQATVSAEEFANSPRVNFTTRHGGALGDSKEITDVRVGCMFGDRTCTADITFATSANDETVRANLSVDGRRLESGEGVRGAVTSDGLIIAYAVGHPTTGAIVRGAAWLRQEVLPR